MNNPLKYTDPSGYQYFRNYDELPFMDSGAGYAAGSAFYRADMISNYGYSAATAMMPHWSVSTRNPGTNHAHMNRRTYDGIYGKGAYDVYYDDFYVSKEVDISTTGNVAEKDFGTVLAWMNMTLNEKDWQLTIIEAFGNTTIIGSFNDPGTIRLGAGGGLIFSNPTAGALAGEAQVAGEKGSLLRTANNFNTLLGISLFGIDRTIKFTRIGRDIAYNFAYTSFAKATNFIKPIGYGTSFAGMFIGGFKFAASDQSWGDYGQLGISLLSSGLTINPSTAPLGIAIGGADILGGFNGFYNYLDTQQQFYENTGGIMIYTNQFPVFMPISTRP